MESLRRRADALGVSADYLLGRVKDPVGEDLEAADPEIAVLFRRFQGMSKEAREQVTVLRNCGRDGQEADAGVEETFLKEWFWCS